MRIKPALRTTNNGADNVVMAILWLWLWCRCGDGGVVTMVSLRG